MTDWTALFPDLDALTPEVRRELVAVARVMELPPDTHLFGPGDRPPAALLVLQGSVKVSQVTEQGREIVLYRVHAGESCVLTTACLLADEDYTAEGRTESAATGVSIPRAAFDRLLGASPAFRNFVFTAYSRRIADLFLMIEDIAFQRMDVRLAARLLELARDDTITATHQDMAAELGTAREVISRLLKDFERRGLVAQSRGMIRLTDPAALERIAERPE